MRILFGLLCILFMNGAVAQKTIGPETLIRQTADRVIQQIKANSEQYQSHPEQLYTLVNKVVLPHFDFVAMTNLALGNYADQFNATQKSEIIHEFQMLLVRTYGKALLEYNDQVITFQSMIGSEVGGEVTVRTEIEQAGGFPIPLHYRLKKSDRGWKVYDIIVDDISLVMNYRSSFSRQIRRKGVVGLIELLRRRNAEQ